MSKLLIDDKPVMVLPKLAVAIGLNEAVVLQQVHYWLMTYREAEKQDHYHDGKWWVYNTKAEWAENFPWWSESTIWRALTSLRDKGLLITTSEYNKKGYDRTLWYTIDYKALHDLEEGILSKRENGCSQSDKMDNVNLTSPIPETTKDYPDISGNSPSDATDFDEAFPPKYPDAQAEDPAFTASDLTTEEGREKAQAHVLSKRKEQREPWRHTFDWIKPRDGIEADTLRRVAWELTEAGIPEPRSGTTKKAWRPAISNVYQEAGGDFKLIRRAAKKLATENLTYWPPHRWPQMIVSLKAKRETGLPSVIPGMTEGSVRVFT